MRTYIWLGAAALALLAVLAIAIASSGTPRYHRLTPVTSSSHAGAAAPIGPPSARAVLAANARQANEILDGSIQAKVVELPGVPVVINQWASWCTNCQFEFPFFQHAARQYGGRVAFVGLDSQDSRPSAQAFLRQHPVDYPSIFDPDASQARAIGGGQAWPTTIYVNSAHQITNIHIGAYPTLQALQQDIARYT